MSEIEHEHGELVVFGTCPRPRPMPRFVGRGRALPSGRVRGPAGKSKYRNRMELTYELLSIFTRLDDRRKQTHLQFSVDMPFTRFKDFISDMTGQGLIEIQVDNIGNRWYRITQKGIEWRDGYKKLRALSGIREEE